MKFFVTSLFSQPTFHYSLYYFKNIPVGACREVLPPSLKSPSIPREYPFGTFIISLFCLWAFKRSTRNNKILRWVSSLTLISWSRTRIKRCHCIWLDRKLFFCVTKTKHLRTFYFWMKVASLLLLNIVRLYGPRACVKNSIRQMSYLIKMI